MNYTKYKRRPAFTQFFPVFENTNQSLSYSIDEAHAIEKEMTSKLFMNADATKSSFTE